MLIFCSTLDVFLPTPGLVDGARCRRSRLGWWPCSPCGRGTRCLYCTWCTGFCFNTRVHGRSAGPSMQYGTEEMPYKMPFMDMFKDIEVRVKGNDMTDLDLVELFKVVSVVTREDCTICNNSPGLDKVSNYTASVYKELEEMIGNIHFKNVAMEKCSMTTNLISTLPESLKIHVDSDSDIMKSNLGKIFHLTSILIMKMLRLT